MYARGINLILVIAMAFQRMSKPWLNNSLRTGEDCLLLDVLGLIEYTELPDLLSNFSAETTPIACADDRPEGTGTWGAYTAQQFRRWSKVGAGMMPFNFLCDYSEKYHHCHN